MKKAAQYTCVTCGKKPLEKNEIGISKKLLGEFVKVKITEAEAWCLHGELIQ